MNQVATHAARFKQEHANDVDGHPNSSTLMPAG